MNPLWLGVPVILLGIWCVAQTIFLASLMRRLDTLERRMDTVGEYVQSRAAMSSTSADFGTLV